MVKWIKSVQPLVRVLSLFTLGFTGSLSESAFGAQDRNPLELAVREVWRTEGGQVADGLSRIRGLAETDLGAIWISDVAGSGRVLMVDPETMRAEVVGETGDGPGEVSSPRQIAITQDARVAVYDIGRSSVEIYESGGEPVRRVRLSAPVEWVKGSLPSRPEASS